MTLHFNDLPGARSVDTAALLTAEQNITDVVGMRGMTLVTGKPGTGKSHATARIAERLPACRPVFVEAGVNPNPRSLANELLSRLTGVPHNENRFSATASIVRWLEREMGVVFLDEAQRLSLHCLEWLRYVHEHVRGRVALVIVGGPLAQRRLQRDHQLWRRITLPSVFVDIPTAQMLQIAPRFHPIWATASKEVLAEAQRHLKGNFGDWAKVTHAVLGVLRRLDADVVDEATLAMALRREGFRLG